MAGGDFYKALNRGSGALSTIWDNIINTVLGNRLKKTLQPPTTKQEEPVLPDAGAVKQEQPYTPPVDNSEQITPDINRSSKQPYIAPESDQTGIESIQGIQTEGVDQTPYIPDGQRQGEAGGKPGSDIPENKVYAPNIYIPTDKSTKTTKPTSSTGKIDTGGLKYTVGSKTPDQQANENLTNEMLNYITETSKFGTRGQNFINTALNAVYPLSYKQGEAPPPKMTGHEITTDVNGNMLQFVYDRKTDSYYTVPVLDPAGNPVKQKLAEYDKNRIQPVVGKDGKIVLKNLQSGEEVETGYTPEEYDYKFGLDKSAEEWNQEYDMMKYNLALQKANKKKGGGNGEGTSSISGDKVVWDMETGMPLDLGDTESPLSKIVQGIYSGNKKTREQNMTLFNLYYGDKYSLADTKVAKSLIPKIRDAGEQYKNGKVTKEQFDTYIQSLQTQYPSEMSWLRKNYAR